MSVYNTQKNKDICITGGNKVKGEGKIYSIECRDENEICEQTLR